MWELFIKVAGAVIGLLFAALLALIGVVYGNLCTKIKELRAMVDLKVDTASCQRIDTATRELLSSKLDSIEESISDFKEDVKENFKTIKEFITVTNGKKKKKFL